MAELTALQRMEKDKSAQHPSPPQCTPLRLIPPVHAGEQPTAFGPTQTGQPGKALRGEALSQAHGHRAECC